MLSFFSQSSWILDIEHSMRRSNGTGLYSHHYVPSQIRAIRIRRDFFDVRDGFQVFRYGTHMCIFIAIAITGIPIIIKYFVSIFTSSSIIPACFTSAGIPPADMMNTSMQTTEGPPLFFSISLQSSEKALRCLNGCGDHSCPFSIHLGTDFDRHRNFRPQSNGGIQELIFCILSQ